MADPAPRPATYDDLRAVPEPLVAELLGGDLVTHPRPAPVHARAVSRLCMVLGSRFDRGRGGPGGWWILVEPEVHLGADVLVPDLAGWRLETLPELPAEAWFATRPDWVCEILSPSTARIDRVRKMPIYAGHSVAHVWLIDPGLETLEVFALEPGTHRWTLLSTHPGTDLVRAEPFGDVELDLSELWSSPVRPSP